MTEKVTFRITPQELEGLDRRAEGDGIPRGEAIRRALAGWMEGGCPSPVADGGDAGRPLGAMPMMSARDLAETMRSLPDGWEILLYRGAECTRIRSSDGVLCVSGPGAYGVVRLPTTVDVEGADVLIRHGFTTVGVSTGAYDSASIVTGVGRRGPVVDRYEPYVLSPQEAGE